MIIISSYMHLKQLTLLYSLLDSSYGLVAAEHQRNVIDMTEETSLNKSKELDVKHHSTWIYLDRPPYEASFKVYNDEMLFQNGYEWIVDRSRCTGFLQTVPQEPNFFKDQTGEQTFNLKGYGYGTCVYRMAYARSNSFTGFDDTANVKKVLQFPVAFTTNIHAPNTPMPEPLPQPTSEPETEPVFETVSDFPVAEFPETDFSESEPNGWRAVQPHNWLWNAGEGEREFILFGGTEWIRMFEGFCSLSDMPVAIASTIARYRGNNDPFLWLVDSDYQKITIPFAHIGNLAV